MTGVILTVLLFLLPGACILFMPGILPRIHRVERLPVAIALSLAYWIVSFWTTSVIPLAFTTLIYASLFIWGFTLLYLSLRHLLARPVRMSTGTAACAVFLALLGLPLIPLTYGTIAPPGADMSMHAYLATIIVTKNGFPQTQYPIVPVNGFGGYPAGFSVLLAAMATVNGDPVYANSYWLTIFTYWLFGGALYLLLRMRFSPTVSFLASAAVLWAGRTPLDFFVWGGNPTILSLAYIILACAVGVLGAGRWTVAFTGILIYSSVLIHYIPPVTAFYIGIMTAPLTGQTLKKILRESRTPWYVIAGAVLLVMPFAVRALPQATGISDAASSFVASLHREELAEWNGSPSPPPVMGQLVFLTNTYGVPVVLLYLASMAMLLIRRRSELFAHGAVALAILLLIANAQYRWLPFSELLYPKRVALFWCIPLALGIAYFLETNLAMLKAKRAAYRYTGLILMLLVAAGLFPAVRATTEYTRNAAKDSVVTADDIAAMKWIDRHTKQTDIILNNYHDAGLWIPAITGRMITRYHTNPVDIGRLGVTKGRETYAFIGSRTLTKRPDIDPVARETLDKMPGNVTEVFRRGNAAVYRLDLDRLP